jgi:hypothetical protein
LEHLRPSNSCRYGSIGIGYTRRRWWGRGIRSEDSGDNGVGVHCPRILRLRNQVVRDWVRVEGRGRVLLGCHKYLNSTGKLRV